jgi:anaerobic magnesium-protoporphyrin IX monomethyl ester cyclase
MKALLVEPPKIPWEMMGNFIAPPLRLAYLVAVLETDGVEVQIVDCNASRLPWSDLSRPSLGRRPVWSAPQP